jgi:hypothetical protein
MAAWEMTDAAVVHCGARKPAAWPHGRAVVVGVPIEHPISIV